MNCLTFLLSWNTSSSTSLPVLLPLESFLHLPNNRKLTWLSLPFVNFSAFLMVCASPVGREMFPHNFRLRLFTEDRGSSNGLIICKQLGYWILKVKPESLAAKCNVFKCVRITLFFFFCRFNNLDMYAAPDHISAVLVGTVCQGNERHVTAERAFKLAEGLQLTYMETDVHDVQMVLWILQKLVNNVIISRARRQSLAISIMPPLKMPAKKKRFKCCGASWQYPVPPVHSQTRGSDVMCTTDISLQTSKTRKENV